MNDKLLSHSKYTPEYIEQYIDTHINSHWKKTWVYKLTNRNPSKGWIHQHKRLMRNKLSKLK